MPKPYTRPARSMFFLDPSPNPLTADEHACARVPRQGQSIAWVESHDANEAQLRFNNKVEGAICLRPSWADMMATAATEASLKHLVPRHAATEVVDSPGTLLGNSYVYCFAAAILLNRELVRMSQAPTDAPARIFMAGMGAGVGISFLLHHFPQASVTVVEKHASVIELAKRHYPLLSWLTGEDASIDGRRRLRIIHGDAGLAMAEPGLRQDADEDRYDVAVMDAFNFQGEHPEHLTTVDHYRQTLQKILTPGGIVISNVKGGYHPPRSWRLRMAIRGMYDAGFQSIHSLPFMWRPNEPFDHSRGYNNLVLASRQPLDPVKNHQGWCRMERFLPYQAIPTSTYLSHVIGVGDDPASIGPLLGFDPDDRGPGAAINAALRNHPHFAPLRTDFGAAGLLQDRTLARLVTEQLTIDKPDAFTDRPTAPGAVYFRSMDHVAYQQWVYRQTLQEARREDHQGRFLHAGDEILAGIEKASA